MVPYEYLRPDMPLSVLKEELPKIYLKHRISQMHVKPLRKKKSAPKSVEELDPVEIDPHVTVGGIPIL